MTLEQQILTELFSALCNAAKICAEIFPTQDKRVLLMFEHLQEVHNRIEVIESRDAAAEAKAAPTPDTDARLAELKADDIEIAVDFEDFARGLELQRDEAERSRLLNNAAATVAIEQRDEYASTLQASIRLHQNNYTDWTIAGGGEECPHGICVAIHCRKCDEERIEKYVKNTRA